MTVARPAISRIDAATSSSDRELTDQQLTADRRPAASFPSGASACARSPAIRCSENDYRGIKYWEVLFERLDALSTLW